MLLFICLMTTSSTTQDAPLCFLFFRLQILTSPSISRVSCCEQKQDMVVLMHFKAYIEHMVPSMGRTTTIYGSLDAVLLLDYDRADRPLCNGEIQAERGNWQRLAQHRRAGQVLFQFEERFFTLVSPHKPVVAL